MSASVARMPEPIRGAPTGGGSAQRVPFAEASRVLLRHSILDGMRDMLVTRDWSSITLSDVARAAGISRQTIYNEFGSRQGLAEGYALRLADRLVDAVAEAIEGNVGNIYAGLPGGIPRLLRGFGVRSARHLAADRRRQARPAADHHHRQCADHLQVLGAPDRDPAASWVRASEEDAGVLARAIVRLAMSYVSMPPEADHDVARDLARLMTPFAERYGVVDTP